MNPGFCSTPGHQDRPGRLYPCGWRCERCRPGRPRLRTAETPAETEQDRAAAA